MAQSTRRRTLWVVALAAAAAGCGAEEPIGQRESKLRDGPYTLQANWYGRSVSCGIDRPHCQLDDGSTAVPVPLVATAEVALTSWSISIRARLPLVKRTGDFDLLLDRSPPSARTLVYKEHDEHLRFESLHVGGMVQLPAENCACQNVRFALRFDGKDGAVRELRGGVLSRGPSCAPSSPLVKRADWYLRVERIECDGDGNPLSGGGNGGSTGGGADAGPKRFDSGGGGSGGSGKGSGGGGSSGGGYGSGGSGWGGYDYGGGCDVETGGCDSSDCNSDGCDSDSSGCDSSGGGCDSGGCDGDLGGGGCDADLGGGGCGGDPSCSIAPRRVRIRLPSTLGVLLPLLLLCHFAGRRRRRRYRRRRKRRKAQG